MEDRTRIGVYLCHCGGNISDTLDVEKVKEAIAHLDGVEVAEIASYVCSNPGQNMIKQGVREHGLNRIVVASCSPRLHLETFRRTVKSEGLNPYLLEMVNIREHCSWIHDDLEESTLKAIDLVRGAVGRARYLEELEPKKITVNRDILVIGGGIAGITAATELADNGYQVYLVEKTPSIGGHMAQLSKTYPTLDCSSCILTPKMVYAVQHPNIKIFSMSEVTSVEGSPGNYRVLGVKHPRYVDEENCTACGECSEKCPVDIPSEFEEGISTRKAIYIPFPQALPNSYVIDKRGTPPCKAACPAGVNVQGYVALISQGQFEEALELVRRDNPLPAVCGRVCFHPCEKECRRNEVDEPLAINALKRFITDYELKKGRGIPEPIPPTHEEKVAVVGSGPAGLTAAYELVKMGYPVTVFESLPKPGGMLRVGIPNYRLPKNILDEEIRLLESTGVKIKCDVTIGKDLTIDELMEQDYAAVLIAIGVQECRKLRIEGEDLQGVVPALEFLKQVNLGKRVRIGPKVAVIGGGNVAIDAARTALRSNAEEVTVLYRRSREEMPAYSTEVEEAEKEGVKFNFLVSPRRILGGEGHVVSLECIRMELGEPDESGRRRPIPIEGSEFVFEADSVIPAVGQSVNMTSLPERVRLSQRKTVVVDPLTHQTNLPGIFAGGDAVTGEATVIDAIAQGKKAAISIDRYLRDEDMRSGREEAALEVAEIPGGRIERKPRQVMPLLPFDQRDQDKEVELGFTEEMAIEEAKRCLACGGCSECLECEKVCEPEGVIDHKQKEQTFELDVGAIIVSTGFEQINPENIREYSFNQHPDIVTNLQFERLMIQGMHKPSDGKPPKKVAFILCVGSRMLDEEAGERYCCKIGCMVAIKQAKLLQKAIPEAEPWIFYIDIRAAGKGYEEFYMDAQEHGVRFVRGRVAEVTPTDEGLFVRAEDTFLGTLIEGTFDLVVLSLGIAPNPTAQELAEELGIHIGSDGFFMEKHYKLSPVDSQRRGMYVSGCALGPKDVRETTLEAMSTALRAATFLGSGEISISPEVAHIIPERCDGCRECVEICPVGAIEDSPTGLMVNPISCVGCGICVPRCPRQAIDLDHCNEAQLLAQIHEVSREGKSPRIVAFLEGNTAYASADLVGQTRLSYSPLVKIIRVPSTGRVGLKHVLTAFAAGADGIVFIEGDDSVFKEETLREHVVQLKKELKEYGIGSLRLIHTTTTIPQYHKIINIFETMVSRISKMDPISNNKRSEIGERIKGNEVMPAKPLT
ncbi:FAD-dependent oxidoreductase [Candidatus Bathyarchaeota archaeon]|nr:FAD-dependent oxidoreductase [Candidatus Bathyarchaeota archaeon]